MSLTPEYLKKLHTKELLKAWHNARFDRGPWFDPGNLDPIQRMISKKEHENAFLSGHVFGFSSYNSTSITLSDLKREIDSRPHVPNKNEARGLRLLKIKSANRRGKRDR